MAKKIIIYDFKTAKKPWFEEVVRVYFKKISFFCDLECISLKTLKQSREDKSQKIKFEEKELLSKLSDDDFIILLDEKGKFLDSLEFSDQFTRCLESGKKRIVFIIGGAFGVSEEIKKRAHLKIALSKMVMNHLIAEAVILEQIYRALTIKNRIPYHNI